MNRTKIEYLTHTWNPMVGCSGIRCQVKDVCWARGQAKRQKHRCHLCYTFTPHWHWERKDQPLKRKKPSMIGVSFMGDFFDKELSDAYRRALLKIMREAHWHTFIILTKQPQNIGDLSIPKNVWIGVSVNRKTDLWRIDELRKVDCLVRIGSFEPLLEPLDPDLKGIDWVIIGAMTRPNKQPDTEWVKHLTEHASSLGIPVFLKNNLTNHNLQQYPVMER